MRNVSVYMELELGRAVWFEMLGKKKKNVFLCRYMEK